MTELTHAHPLSLNQAAELLGASTAASVEELRLAYLQKLQQYPPDRDPDMFEQIRDAYRQLQNPELRAEAVLLEGKGNKTLSQLLDGVPPIRRFAGSQIWTELLKEKRS